MRISDWSSDVCSSDLRFPHDRRAAQLFGRIRIHEVRRDVERQANRLFPRGMVERGQEMIEWRADLHAMRDALCAADFRNDQCSDVRPAGRSEEHTSELQSLMRISYAVFCLKKNNK